MKKKVITVAMVALLAFMLVGCSSEKTEDAESEHIVKPLEKIFEIGGYPVCDGSALTLPLSEAICSALTDTPRADVYERVLHNGKATALSNLFNGYTDIIFVEGTEIELNAKAEKAGVKVELYPIAEDYYAFYVNSEKISEKNISEETADSIISGKNRNGIKYCKGYYLSGYLPQNLTVLSVDDIFPTDENVNSGEYPYTFNYYAIIRADSPKDSGERKIVNALLSEAGQLLVEGEGYVKIKLEK